MASIEVLNATQANVEAPVEIQLSLGNPIYRGPKGKTPVKGVDYFTQEDINNIVTQIEGDGGIDLTSYATKAYVDEAIGGVVVEETDPTVPEWAKQETKPTYTANEVGALPADTVLFSGNYEDLSNKPTIPVVPTNVSSFTNDAGYLTTHQSLTDYATEEYVNNLINSVILKRPLRVITINLGEQDATSNQINGNFIYRLEIRGNKLFPSDEDYNWANNFLVYGFKEYPFVFKIVYRNSTSTLYLYPQSALINYYNWDEEKDHKGRFIITNYGSTSPMLNYVNWGPHINDWGNGTSSFSKKMQETYSIEWTYDLDAPGAPLTQWINNKFAAKSYVETLIRGAETGLLKREIVQALPTEDIDDNTIYMVPKTGSTGDVYDEYLYINNTWERIGSTDVDLTGYATEQWVNNNQLKGSQSILVNDDKTIASLIPLNTLLPWLYFKAGETGYRNRPNQAQYDNDGMLLPYDINDDEIFTEAFQIVNNLEDYYNHLKKYGFCIYNQLNSATDNGSGPNKAEIEAALNITISHIHKYYTNQLTPVYTGDLDGLRQRYKNGVDMLGKDCEGRIIILYFQDKYKFRNWIRKSILCTIPAPNDDKMPNIAAQMPTTKNFNVFLETIDTMFGQRPATEYLSNSDILSIWNSNI